MHPSLHKGLAFPWLNLVTFFFLYIAQSLPSSFLSSALPVMMRQADYSLSAIALLPIIKMPWVLKFAWSPLIDRNCNSLVDYKRCIIGAEIAYAILILIVGCFSSNSNFYWLLALISISLIASATQDIATDALSVRVFDNCSKSMANSMQSMGSFGGAMIGSGVLLIVLHKYGWNIVVPCLSAFVILAILPLLFNKRLRINETEKRRRAKLTDFVWFFAQKGIGKQVGFLMLYYSSIIATLSILRPYLVDLGYTMKSIGMMSGILGTACAFTAALVGGIIARQFGLERSRIAFAVLALVSSLYFVVISWITSSTLLICFGIALLWCSYGVATIVVYTSAMECVRPGCEGTDFTIQTVITHLSGILVAMLSGKVADAFGYSGFFVMATGLALTSLVYVLFIFGNKSKLNASIAATIARSVVSKQEG